MRHLVYLLALCAVSIALRAQSTRVMALQNARNLVVTTTDLRSYYYLITSEQIQTMRRADGRLAIGRDTFAPADIAAMRFQSLPKFSLDEDSTAIQADYAVDHGLLALRRTFCLGHWNSLVVPFGLTGKQLREAFGDDALLARPRGVTEAGGEAMTVEFETIATDTDDVVVEPGGHYLLWLTRQPDVAEGAATNVAYGAQRIAGPVYVVPNVSLASGQQQPDYMVLRSATDQSRLRIRGTYVCRDEDNPLSQGRYQLYGVGDDDGLFRQLPDASTLKAFRSWIELMRNNGNLPVRFYVDGIHQDLTAASGIFAPWVDGSNLEHGQRVFDLQGRSVGQPQTKGIYVINGRKVVVR